MKFVWGLAIAFTVCACTLAEETRTVTLDTPEGRVEGATLTLHADHATLALPSRPDGPSRIMLTPTQLAQLKRFFADAPHADSAVAIPHGTSGLYQNAVVQNLVLEMPAKGSLIALQFSVDVGTPRVGGGTIRQRLPMSWVAKAYASDHPQVSVDNGNGPEAAKVLEVDPPLAPGAAARDRPRKARVLIGTRVVNVPVTSLLYADPQNPPTEAMIWRTHFSEEAGRALRADIARMQVQRYFDTHSATVGTREAIHGALPLWTAQLAAAKTPDEYRRLLERMPLAPIPAHLGAGERADYQRADRATHPTFHLTRDLVVLQTLPQLLAMKPTVEQYLAILGSHGMEAGTQSMVKTVALSAVKTPAQLEAVLTARPTDERNPMLTREDMGFFGRHGAKHFFAVGGTPDQFVELLGRLTIPGAMAVPELPERPGQISFYAQMLHASMEEYFKAGGRISGFVKLLERIPTGHQRSFLAYQWRESIFQTKPAPTFAEVQALLHVGIDKESAHAIAIELIQHQIGTPAEMVQVVREARLNTNRVPGPDRVLNRSADHRPESIADNLVDHVLFIARDAGFSHADLVALGKEATGFNMRMKVATEAVEHAHDGRQYLDALALVNPTNAGQERVVRDFLQTTFTRRFLALDPSIREINECLSSRALRADPTTQQVLLLKALQTVQNEREYRALRFPWWLERQPFFAEALAKFQADHPTWRRGVFDWACHQFKKFAG